MIPLSEKQETGLPWIPSLPNRWRLIKLKYLVVERSEKGYPEEPLLTASQSHGVIEKKDYGTRTVEAQKDLHLLKLVEPGDYVISLRSFQGGIEYAHKRGIISPAYTILKPGPDVRRGFFEHYFKSAPFVGAMSLFVTGIREGQNIDYVRLSRSYMPVPPLEEQEQIGRFVRHLDSKVNRLINAKRRLIELLNEQKQAIIHQAVTRGLDPTVPLKPSGIDWLGDIPAHWGHSKLRYLTRQIVDGTHFTPNYIEEGVAFLRVTDIHSESLDQEKLRRISPEEHQMLNKRCNPEKGDLLLSKNGTIGVTRVVDWDFPCSLFVSLCLVKPRKDMLDSAFAALAFEGGLLATQLIDSSKQTSVTNLHLDKIRGLTLPVPPILEQRRIVSQMLASTKTQRQAIEKARIEIDLIREYRTRLVADVVTGQLDVRHLDLPGIEEVMMESIEATDLESDIDETDDILEEAEV